MVDDAPTQEEQADLAQRLRRVPEVAEALDRMWPRLSPHEFLHDLFGARPLLAAAGRGILGDDGGAAPVPPAQHVAGRGALDGGGHRADRRGPHSARPAARRTDQPCPGPEERGRHRPRTSAFWPQGLATSPVPVTSPASGSEDEIRAFGHIVVDEVQDLSPMQLRMLARRSLSGSMTVVGDIAQATGPWAPAGVGRRHPPPEPATPTPPGGADGELPHPVGGRGAGRAGPGRGGADHLPAAPGPPSRRHAADRPDHAWSGWPPAVADIAREETVAVFPGRVAVLGPAVMLPELTRALAEAGLDPVDPRDPARRRPGGGARRAAGRRDERPRVRLGRSSWSRR